MQAPISPPGSGLPARFARWCRAVTGDRLSLFSVIWAVTGLVHVIPFYHYRKLLYGSARCE